MLKGIRKMDDFSANCLFRWKWRLKRGGPHMVVYRGTISPDAIGNPMCQYGRNEMNRRHPLRKGRGFFVRWRRRRRWIYENVTYYRLVGLRRRCLYIYSRGLRDGVFVVHHTHSHTQWWWWRKATHTHTHIRTPN